MKIMAVDYGDARTGIAFSDIRGILASPHSVIEESYAPKLADKIASLAESNKAELIVIGLPVNMDGSQGYRCEQCRALGDLVREKTDISVIFEDERMTTVIAHGMLSDNNVRGKKRKSQVDAVSASVILQSYLDKNK